MSQNSGRLNLLSFSGNIRILHLTWFAFFLTFVMWFNHAPLLASIRETLGLSKDQIQTLLILNVAMTIPARVIIGMLVDHFGPKRTYSSLLVISGFLCILFAIAQSFEMLALTRFLLGFVGAGFVIGIRMISEWFPAKQVGVAEGIYGGWGNFGSAAAAMALPTLALIFGGDNGWRYAIGVTGIIGIIYGVIYFFTVTDTPKGSTYFKPKRTGAMEVTSVGDLYFYIGMNIPMYLALAVLAWKLSPSGVSLIGSQTTLFIYAGLVVVFLYQSYHAYLVNKDIFTKPVPKLHQYKFKQVAILDLAYLAAFGSELAVVSMLPLFFVDTFELSQVSAGLLASGYAFMNLVSRPGGGLISDRFGRKKTMTVMLTGLTIGYFAMSQIDSNWPILLAVLATMACSFFVQAGEGAVFALVPLIKRRLTGQIAGMAGAYGNVGSVLFLTVLSFVSPQMFFLVIAVSAMVATVAVQFLEEPRGQMAEILPDGTVAMIDME
ncbi:MAG: NarK family nitrate/nitrite MFS transporter [Pseudomonadota bacterium]|nr:NarK family nitrate/nitrite MFS transporter [Pseudomonadota bacterium]